MVQLVASMSGVVLGGVVEIVGSYIIRGEIFTTQSFLKVLKMVYKINSFYGNMEAEK